MARPPVSAIVITGPTGTGKSELAVEVAELVDGAIVSADSRQVYRGMDVGTAKPPPSARERVPHYGIDIIDPDQRYSAGRFARDAWRWIEDIRERGRTPVVAGGTGLFLRALLDPLAPEPRLEPERRERLRRLLDRFAPGELKRWLERLDPQRAAALRGEGGRQRLGRSLEVALLSGRPHSWWLSREPAGEPLEARVFCLDLPRPQLYRRLDARFDAMLEGGLVEETRRLLERYPPDAPGLDSVGYGEIAAYLSGARTLDEAVEEAKRSTRRFAKRQLTWFRHQLPEDAVRLDANRPSAELATEIVEGGGSAGQASRRSIGCSDL